MVDEETPTTLKTEKLSKSFNAYIYNSTVYFFSIYTYRLITEEKQATNPVLTFDRCSWLATEYYWGSILIYSEGRNKKYNSWRSDITSTISSLTFSHGLKPESHWERKDALPFSTDKNNHNNQKPLIHRIKIKTLQINCCLFFSIETINVF